MRTRESYSLAFGLFFSALLITAGWITPGNSMLSEASFLLRYPGLFLVTHMTALGRPAAYVILYLANAIFYAFAALMIVKFIAAIKQRKG